LPASSIKRNIITIFMSIELMLNRRQPYLVAVAQCGTRSPDRSSSSSHGRRRSPKPP